jgi:hypothetical protein
MTRLLDCNDAALRLWQAGEAVWSPGMVWFSDGRYQFGEAAWRQSRRSPREINSRYWHRLSTQPLSPALGPARHTADLVHAHLEQVLGKEAGSIMLAIPGAMESAQLSLLLGILQTLPCDTRAVVHRSALVGASAGRSCVHIELQLHQSSMTRVDVEAGVAKARDTQILPGSGLMGLLDHIAEGIGHQFVEQTRFDPQKRAETEQALYEAIPDLLRTLSGRGEASCSIEGHTARITADVVETIGKTLARDLTALVPDDIELVALDAMLANLPGLRFAQSVIEVAPQWIPSGTEGLLAGGETDALTFQRQVPCANAEPAATPTSAKPAQAATPAITHLLQSGQAIALGAAGTIADGVTLTRTASDNRLHVASGLDARLNGQPIAGECAAQPGDELTLGDRRIQLIHVSD